MKILYPGHRYELPHLDGEGKTILQFVQRPPFHKPRQGILNQDLFRALIDRVELLDSEVPWELNDEILFHLRMALGLHEARAMLRKIEKRQLLPEKVTTAPDGHFII